MLTIKPTTKFQKDVKRAQKRGYDMALLTEIIKQLAAGEPLPAKNRDHALSGNWGPDVSGLCAAGCMRCLA